MNKAFSAAAAAVLCGAVAGAAFPGLPARAAEQDPPTRIVKYDDLDLSKPAGAESLYRRIKAAAREVCRQSVESDKDLAGLERRCFERAVDAAVIDVKSPLLTDLRYGKALRLARQ